MVSDEALLSYVCNELISEIHSQPICRRSKSSLSINEIECAVNTLGWDMTTMQKVLPSRFSQSDRLTHSELENIWTNASHFPTKVEDMCTAQIYMYQQADWKPTMSEASHTLNSSTTTTSSSSSSTSSSSLLPDGIQEFIRQIEHLYETNISDEPIDGRDQMLESLATSQHMPICFPYLVKFAVNKIRVTYRRDGQTVLKVLDLLRHIVRNVYFDLTKCEPMFDLLVACLVMLVTDMNLLSMVVESRKDIVRSTESVEIRKTSANLLCDLVDSKIGKYHAIILIDQLIDLHLVPLVEMLRRKLGSLTTELVEEVRERMEEVKESACTLMRDLMKVNKSVLATKDRIEFIDL